MNVIHYILFILFFLIMYSVCFKTVEGFDDEFYYYNKLIDYKTMPNSFVNDATPSRTVNKFGFYKGKGTFKKGYTKETKSGEKISSLNKLLNRLLGKIESDNQDCVGSFDKYSECDKSCGSNSFQTRKYNITQERGKNGKDCPFVDGYEEQKRCNLDLCQLGDICKNNDDCETGNCNPNSTRCENMVPCDINNYNVCNEKDCIELNDKYDNNVMREGTFIYNNVDEQCFFKTPAEIEKLNLNVFTFNYRTISQQVENLALDCDYFQVKKDGVGPCVNASNVIIEEGVPKCLPGYGPEPTMFNGSLACSECIIPDPSDDNASMECGPGRTGTSSILCTDTSIPLWFLKKKGDSPDGSCVPACDRGQQVRKSGSYVSCRTCPTNSAPYSDNCRSTGSDDLNLNSGNCSNDSYRNNYLEFPDGNPADSLLNNNYNEKCYNEDNPTEPCPPDQSKIGGNCVCSGPGMNRDVPGSDGTCENNCLPGYYWENGRCVACTSQVDLGSCEAEDSGICVIYANPDGQSIHYNRCIKCEEGYQLGNSGTCDSCADGYINTGFSDKGFTKITCTENTPDLCNVEREASRAGEELVSCIGRLNTDLRSNIVSIDSTSSPSPICQSSTGKYFGDGGEHIRVPTFYCADGGSHKGYIKVPGDENSIDFYNNCCKKV
jgi:hypothetical protein